MDPYFLFGDPGNELLAALILFSVVTVCALAFGGVYVHRYYKTRARRNLVIALLLIMAVPSLAYLGMVWDANSVQARVMAGTIVDPDLFQNHAKD